MSDLTIMVSQTDDMGWALEAAKDLASAAEKDLLTLKGKAWYSRLLDTITFSKNDQIQVAKDVGSLAKLQEIMTRMVVILSRDNAEISNALREYAQLLEQMNQKDGILLKAIQKMKFGGTAQISFSDLDWEKKERIANLLVMADQPVQTNSESQRYISSVLDNSNVVTLDRTLKSEAVETLSKEEQELLYRMIMINRHLLNIDFEEDSEVVDFISINRKRKKEICEAIQDTARYVSPDFFASYYEKTNEAYNKIDDEDIIFQPMESLHNSDSYENASDTNAQLTFDGCQDVVIPGIVGIHENKTRQYKDKELHIPSVIECEGNLEFYHCIIHYGEGEEYGEINISGNGSITMESCRIVCHSYNSERAFINDTSQGKQPKFINCQFINCCSFLRTRNAFFLQDCKIDNLGTQFIRCGRGLLGTSASMIRNCVFLNFNPPDFMSEPMKEKTWTDAEDIIKAEYLVVDGCTVKGDPNAYYKNGKNQKIRQWFIRASDLMVRNTHVEGIANSFSGVSEMSCCTFNECREVLSTSWQHRRNGKRTKITECIFTGCTSIVGSIEQADILYCKFLNCFDTLIETGYNGDVNIQNCQFKNWEGASEKGMREKLGYGSMLLFRSSKDKGFSSSCVKYCEFSQIIAHECFVIRGSVTENIRDYVANVENCIFSDCSTERKSGKLIKEYDTYLGLFNMEKSVTAIHISSCRGLDQVRQM